MTSRKPEARSLKIDHPQVSSASGGQGSWHGLTNHINRELRRWHEGGSFLNTKGIRQTSIKDLYGVAGARDNCFVPDPALFDCPIPKTPTHT